MYLYRRNTIPGNKWIKNNGLSFADDLPIASFTSYELQKKIVKVFI